MNIEPLSKRILDLKKLMQQIASKRLGESISMASYREQRTHAQEPLATSGMDTAVLLND